MLLREKNLPRCDWRAVVVRQTMPGADGLVRRVRVALLDARGKVRESERAISELVLLYSPNSPDSGRGECDVTPKGIMI